MKPDLKQLKIKAKTEADKASDLKKLDLVYKKYLGKKGEIADIFSSLKTLSVDLKKDIGQSANLLKKDLEKLFAEKKKKLERQEK